MIKSFILSLLEDSPGWRFCYPPSGGAFWGVAIPFRRDAETAAGDRDQCDWEDPPDRRRRIDAPPDNGDRP